MIYCDLSESKWARPMVRMDKIMRRWLEYDPVALAILVLGIAAVELLSLSF